MIRIPSEFYDSDSLGSNLGFLGEYTQRRAKGYNSKELIDNQFHD